MRDIRYEKPQQDHRLNGLKRNINHDSRIPLLGSEIGYESGRFYPHLEKIKKRSNYLRANMRYYSKDLSFENQYLLWSAYVRPYYIYTAPIIETQTQTIQKRFRFLLAN